MASGIYSITAPSGKCYIGSAKNFARRWRQHLNELHKGTHHNAGLQSAYNKYGKDGLVFAVLEACAVGELLIREQFHIDSVPARALYNACPIAGSRAGSEIPQAHRDKLRAALKAASATPEARARLSATAAARWAKPGAREAFSAKTTGRERSKAHRQALRQANLGKRATLATRQKQSLAKLGKRLPDEVYARQAATRTGKKRANSTSGFYGVTRDNRSNSWIAEVTHNKERRRVGSYKTATLAFAMRLVYLEAWPYREYK